MTAAIAWPSTDDRPRRTYARAALDRVEAVLAEAAAAGARCPTNREISAALAITEEAAKTYVRRLVAAGRIRIVVSAKSAGRVVEIAATGARTAADGPRLALVPAPAAPKPAPRRLPVRRAVAVEAPPAAATPPAARARPAPRRLSPPVRFACESIDLVLAHQLRTGCGWIEGDLPSGDWRYCNHPVEPGTSWCRHHYGRCYAPRPVPGAA